MARDYPRELAERNARAQREGFSSYADKRATLATREGFTRAQGRGHPGREELPITTHRAIERDLSAASMSYLVSEPHGKDLEGKSLLLVTLPDGTERTYILRRAQTKSLLGTIEKRNKLRKRKRGPQAGLPPVPPPQETP